MSLENMFVESGRKRPHENNMSHVLLIGSRRQPDRSGHARIFHPSCNPVRSRLAIFRDAVENLAHQHTYQHGKNNTKPVKIVAAAKEWLHYEAIGARLRMAHRCAEWDGWEEGLVDSILGPDDTEDEWFKDTECTTNVVSASSAPVYAESKASSSGANSGALMAASFKRRKQVGRIPFKKEREKEHMLNTTGDICGGRGGELGRRLEAWLSVNGDGSRRGWDEEYDEEVV